MVDRRTHEDACAVFSWLDSGFGADIAYRAYDMEDAGHLCLFFFLWYESSRWPHSGREELPTREESVEHLCDMWSVWIQECQDIEYDEAHHFR